MSARIRYLPNLALLASVAVSTLVADPAAAHGPPAQLRFWGNYPPNTAACQRVISHATSTCGLLGIKARVKCSLAQAAGSTCSTEEMEQRIQAARSKARALVRRVCSTAEVRQLLYVDVDEALADVINVCRQLETAAISAIFGPFVSGGVVLPQSPQAQPCIAAAASQIRKLLRFGVDEIQVPLDRIASHNIPQLEKLPMVDRSRGQVIARTAAIAALIEDRCPDEQFRAVYGRSAPELLKNLARHLECFGGGLYVQDEVICPDSACGNGVEEPGEDCDDGNRIEGDDCPANCQR